MAGITKEHVMLFLTVLLTCAFIAGFFLKLVGSEAFIGIATNVITYWFAKQQAVGNGPPGGN